MKTQIYFRADGHSKMGLGHVVRSLALADCLKDQFDCRFIIRNPSDSIRTLIEKSCSEIYELPELTNGVGAPHLSHTASNGFLQTGSVRCTSPEEIQRTESIDRTNIENTVLATHFTDSACKIDIESTSSKVRSTDPVCRKKDLKGLHQGAAHRHRL